MLKKWVWSLWSQGSKFECILRMNRWNELISLHAGGNLGQLTVILTILGGRGQK